MSAPRRGDVLALTAGASLISTAGIFVKLTHVAPTLSAFYRMLFGGLMLLVLLPLLRQWRWPTPSLVLALLLPAVAFSADLMMWHRSIAAVGPGLATLLANFQVFIMALVGILFYRERPGWHFVAGLVLAFTGLWLLVGRGWEAFTAAYRLGVIFGILTGLAYAVYLLSFRRIQVRHPQSTVLPFLCWFSLMGAIALGLVGWIEDASFVIPDDQSWAALLALALFGQVLGWWLIARAMPRLPISLVGLLLLLQPTLAFLLDVILFDRPTGSSDWWGVGASLLGIFIGSMPKKHPNPNV